MTGFRECRQPWLLFIAAVVGCSPAIAKEHRVSDQAAYGRAVKQAQPGDVIVLADGEWRDFRIVFEGQGTADRPVTLTAQTKGRVFITGQSNLRLAGEHLVVSGLVFRDGHTPADEVISFRRDSKRLANHSRVTEVVIDRFNPAERSRQDHWVSMYGRFNRVDHSHFAGKSNAGVTLAVIREDGAPLDNQHRIDHNYFGFRPPLGSNGGETIRIGTSEQSLSASHSVVERNYFEHCDGEVEIVSSKSGGNTFRGNTFFESQGSLVLRHGNDNLVEGNVFFGNGKPHTGGIRVINARQTVRGNYMEGLSGTGFASALAVMNGVPNSVINRYHQVSGALIENNTIVDAARLTLGAGADAERSAPPVDSRFERNLIVSRRAEDPFLAETDLAGLKFAGNAQSKVSKPILSEGIARQSIELKREGNGLLYPTDPALAKVGAPRSLAPVKKEETGVAWYPKPAKGEVEFGHGQTHRVTSSTALPAAIAAAKDGDMIQLAAGEYVVAAPLIIESAVTIAGPGRASSGEVATIRFTQSSLFVLRQGGDLRLQGVQISGAEAPTRGGNVVINVDTQHATAHYAIEILNSEFVDLNRSARFDIVAVSPESFGQRLEIRDSTFTNVSGAVLAVRARDEKDPLYALESVDITGSRFSNVGRVADVFRGGRDESTFGPRFSLTNSTVTKSGTGSGASVRLSGVLFTRIAGNRFSDSAPIEVTHGVGAPQTSIIENTFANTAAPVVRELYAKAPPRAEQAGEQAQPYPLLFQQEFERARQEVNAAMDAGIQVPAPKDPGGGYTHEQHKRNYKTIYQAGLLYRITGERKYADFVQRLLLAYAELCPTLGAHPVAANETAGRLFWQSLNDSVWLVHAAQGYDAVRDALPVNDRQVIDRQVFRVMAKFLSDDSPQVFNRIHNHATWANAAVGMTGYVLRDREMVDKALLGLDKTGTAGFLKQLDLLFSPDGYYTEGPYYQRYALLPFVIFAQAIQSNQPERKIFEYRDGIVLKAIRTTIQLTYDGYFFPLNDAMPDKSLKTDELYQAVATAYRVTGDPTLLSIAQWQGRVVLAPEGLAVARDIAAGKAAPFEFTSQLLRDGPRGEQGALAILRAPAQTLVMKNTAQGMGHGHFDKLNWILYDNDNAIVTDYGAARFLNIQAKAGGRYLPENDSWAKQTIAHNTLVVNERSHFDGNLKTAEKTAPKQLFFAGQGVTQLSTAEISTAYPGVSIRRTLAQLTVGGYESPLVVDVLRATSAAAAKFDLPLHYSGHVIEVGFALQSNATTRPVLGAANGYQHLWVDATGTPANDKNYVTWLNDGRFYTYRVVPPPGAQMIFAESGANDPNFNLRREPVLIQRVTGATNVTFVSLLEPHGRHDGANETTVGSQSSVRALRHQRIAGAEVVQIELGNGKSTILAIADAVDGNATHTVNIAGRALTWQGHVGRFDQ